MNAHIAELCPAEHSLRRLIDELAAGMRGAGLRRLLLPGKAISCVEALKTGSPEDIAVLMKDVAGEAISLSAGQSVGGPEATSALAIAQAQVMVNLRTASGHFENCISDSMAAQNLLSDHQREMLSWVRTGSINSDFPISPSDLTLIGREFLVTPDLRLAAVCVFVATSEVMRSGLELFSV